MQGILAISGMNPRYFPTVFEQISLNFWLNIKRTKPVSNSRDGSDLINISQSNFGSFDFNVKVIYLNDEV